MKDIAVEYLGGSGFLVSLGDIGMLFDASEHGGDSRLLPDREKLAAYRRLYVFVSHRHDDHFSESIYDLCGSEAIYIVGFDLPQPHRGVRMEPGEERGFGPVQVKAFGSTDEGVSFLVEMAGITLFHAGDLNLWHWRDESSITEIEAAESAFYACVAPIPKQAIDVAFFPVDPRQGSMYDAGAGYFIMTVKPKIMIPMHFQGRADVAVRFASVGSTPQTQVIAMTEPGERIDLTLPETDESARGRVLRRTAGRHARAAGRRRRGRRRPRNHPGRRKSRRGSGSGSGSGSESGNGSGSQSGSGRRRDAGRGRNRRRSNRRIRSRNRS